MHVHVSKIYFDGHKISPNPAILALQKYFEMRGQDLTIMQENQHSRNFHNIHVSQSMAFTRIRMKVKIVSHLIWVEFYDEIYSICYLIYRVELYVVNEMHSIIFGYLIYDCYCVYFMSVGVPMQTEPPLATFEPPTKGK